MRAVLPVFYTPAMAADARSFSPSASKPDKVIEHWRTIGLPIDIIAPPPATTAELYLAHDHAFVDDVLACKTDNGFGNRSPEVARTLPFTTGAMLAAARHVLTLGGIACAPCSGFHHAGYRIAGGYCTFNGLMVTAC